MTPARARLLLALLLLLPWVLRAPRLWQKEVAKLHLADTLALPREIRKEYLLLRALPCGIEPDYFDLIRAAQQQFGHRRVRYTLAIPAGLPSLQSDMLQWGYLVYELNPSKQVLDPSEADFRLYYRVPPPPDARVWERIDAPLPSYITGPLP